MPERILNSWKEIAQYIGRGVRTVQRWERELSFPVRRPRSHQRSAVIAFPDEIDAWLKRAQSRRPGETDFAPHFQLLRRNAELLATTTKRLAVRHELLRQQLNHTLQLSRKLRSRRAAGKPRPAKKSTVAG